MKTMIQWTNEERSQIVEQYIKDYHQTIPSDRMIKESADQVLPPERRRNHISPFDPVKKLIAQKQGRPWDDEAIKRQMREDRAKYNKNHPKRKTNQPKLQRSNNSIAPTFGQSKQDERNRELRQIHRRAIASAMNALQIASEIDQLINE